MIPEVGVFRPYNIIFMPQNALLSHRCTWNSTCALFFNFHGNNIVLSPKTKQFSHHYLIISTNCFGPSPAHMVSLFILAFNNKIRGGCKTSAGLSGWAIVFVLCFVQCQGLTPLPPNVEISRAGFASAGVRGDVIFLCRFSRLGLENDAPGELPGYPNGLYPGFLYSLCWFSRMSGL